MYGIDVSNARYHKPCPLSVKKVRKHILTLFVYSFNHGGWGHQNET